jgi:hypothetical protein
MTTRRPDWSAVAGNITKIAGAVAVMAVVFDLYGRINYVLDVVNPDALVNFQREQAIEEVKRDMRWCLGKAVLLDELDRRRILECAD